MDKKDILELNRKRQQEDEDVGIYEKRKIALTGRNCVFVMIPFLQLLNVIAGKGEVNQQLYWILFALLGGECFSYYRLRKRKLYLVFFILLALLLIYEIGKYMIAIGP